MVTAEDEEAAVRTAVGVPTVVVEPTDEATVSAAERLNALPH